MLITLARRNGATGRLPIPSRIHLVGGAQLCVGSITLQWEGPFQGGWRISEVKTP